MAKQWFVYMLGDATLSTPGVPRDLYTDKGAEIVRLDCREAPGYTVRLPLFRVTEERLIQLATLNHLEMDNAFLVFWKTSPQSRLVRALRPRGFKRLVNRYVRASDRAPLQ